MEISKELKTFIQKHSEEIDANKWKKIYMSEDWVNLSTTGNGQFTGIMYQAGLDPLLYMDNVPKYFLIKSSITGKFIIPNHITSIGDFAFEGCISLTNIIIPVSVTHIGNGAFANCRGLTSITIPDNIMSIGNSAFYCCTGLTSVDIPNSVTSIDTSAFYGCMNLTSINFTGTKAQWNAISKGSSWNTDTGSYTVHCTDGEENNK